MKRIFAVALILAAGFLTTGSAIAQQHNTVVANIPFTFILNGRSLPAGHYTISSDFNTPNVLRIEDRKDSVHIMTMAMSGADESQNNNTLVFHRYGNQHFLSAIRANGASLNCHLATSKQEKWAKAQTQEASLRVNDDILIALE